jgi:hypothetical protein
MKIGKFMTKSSSCVRKLVVRVVTLCPRKKRSVLNVTGVQVQELSHKQEHLSDGWLPDFQPFMIL